MDSEYSFRTGNIEEFVLERVALYEDIHMMRAKEPELGFFLQYIAEDIALGCSLGLNSTEVRIPTKVYQRRLETNPLFIEQATITQYMCTLSSNPFGTLSKGAIDGVHSLIKKYSKEESIQNIIKDFDIMNKKTQTTENESAQEEEETSPFSDSKKYILIKSVVIKRSALTSEQKKINTAKNLKRYEDLQQDLEKAQADFSTLIRLMDKAYAEHQMTKDMVLLKRTSSAGEKTGQMTYKAKLLIREYNLKDKSFSLPRKMNKRGCKAYEFLDNIRIIQERITAQLEANNLITSIPAPKLQDLLTVLVKAQMLEEEFIAFCNQEETPKCQDYFHRLNELRIDLLYYLEEKKYAKEDKAAEDLVGQQYLQGRLDKIRSAIYGTYNKAKQISRTIWHLKKEAQKDK